MRILIVLVLVVLLYYMLRGLLHPRREDRDTQGRHPDVGQAGGNELVKDPSCQTYISITTAFRARIGGKDLFFCSEACMNRYLQEQKGRSSEAG